MLPVQVADLCGGALPAVIQILAALRARDGGACASGAGARSAGSGQGAFIDVSMTDNAYALMTMPQARHSSNPVPTTPSALRCDAHVLAHLSLVTRHLSLVLHRARVWVRVATCCAAHTRAMTCTKRPMDISRSPTPCLTFTCCLHLLIAALRCVAADRSVRWSLSSGRRCVQRWICRICFPSSFAPALRARR